MSGVRHRVGIIGGGLAGLAAGCVLADAGCEVQLFERRPFLGGRASSYQHPGTGEEVDNCQHVLLGCCTNLLDFYQRIGVADRIRWYDRLTFIEPGGRRSEIAPGMLPAPFHSSIAFLQNQALGLADKLAISRAMMSLAKGLPEDSPQPFSQWLREHGQTTQAIERFWKPVLVSALNEDLDRMSSRYAGQVFRESFLKSPEAGVMGLPTVHLTALYDRAAEYIRARGGHVELRASVEALGIGNDAVEVRAGHAAINFDFVVAAIPFNHLGGLLSSHAEVNSLNNQLNTLETSPITGIHLWFDREVTELHHAVLLDRTIQWMFHKSKIVGGGSEGSYIELVVSSSKSLVERTKQEIIDLALRELVEFFPQVADAKLLKSTVIKEVHATYSALPQSDRYRPPQRTQWPRLLLAGDWTLTGWPATMEGAVRSGYMAAEALVSTAGTPRTFLQPDLPARGLMKIFG